MTPAETWYAHFRRDRKRKAEVIETIEAVQREALDHAAGLAERLAEAQGITASAREYLRCAAGLIREWKP